MTLHIGEIAPNFIARTTQGTIEFHDWMAQDWTLFFSHPADFTPVCTTEIGCVARHEKALSDRGVKSLGLSTDSLDAHYAWIDDVNETQHVDMFVPIVSDPEQRIAALFNMIHPCQSVNKTVRTVYIIDPHKQIRICLTYPMEVGRNFNEILRVIDALQLADKHTVVTPANWMPGDQAIIPPSIRDDQARFMFPRGWTQVNRYLRYTPVIANMIPS